MLNPAKLFFATSARRTVLTPERRILGSDACKLRQGAANIGLSDVPLARAGRKIAFLPISEFDLAADPARICQGGGR